MSAAMEEAALEAEMAAMMADMMPKPCDPNADKS